MFNLNQSLYKKYGRQMGFFGQQALIRFIVPFMNLFNQTMPCNYRFQGFVGSLVWHSFRIADNEVLRWVSSEASLGS